MADLRPLVTRPEIERQVRQCFPREIAACDDLLAVAWRMLGTDPWTGRPMTDAPADRLIISEAARGLKTYRASIDAALGGFGSQSAMLDRTLFEGMAVAYWVRANPELAAERFEQHSGHLRGIWKKRLLAQGMDAEVPDVPAEEEQRKLNKLFGPWGDKLWCGLPMHEVIAAIEDQWEEGDRRNELKGFFRIAHANNVETMHTTAMSLSGGVVRDNPTNFEVDAGPSLHQVERGLAGAFWPMAHLLKVAADHDEIDGYEEVEATFLRLRAAFVSLDPAIAKETGRNDPCPCNSGKKYKHCHGR